MSNITLEYDLSNIGVGKLALLMSMTPNAQQELLFHQCLKDTRYVGCFTEVGGEHHEFPRKLCRAVIGASLNNNIISKTPYEVHALLHAAAEAQRSFVINSAASANIFVKACIVREEHWIAVSIFGQSAMSTLTNHQRVGLGVMHI